VAVNPVTNKIYLANWDGSAAVIDGTTNNVTTLASGAVSCIAVAVNPVTNNIYIYVGCPNTNIVTIIDGATNSINTVSTGAYPGAIAINLLTNKVYVANLDSSNVTVIAPNTTQKAPLTATVQGAVDAQTVNGLALFATANANPLFTANVTSSCTSTAPTPTALFYQLDTAQGTWQKAAASSGNGVNTFTPNNAPLDVHMAFVSSSNGANPGSYTFALNNVPQGVHTALVFAVYGEEGTSQGSQYGGSSPQISNLTAYTFAVMAPLPVPSASGQALTTSMNTPLPLTLAATNSPTNWSYAQPSHGVVSGTAPNVTYTPTTGYTGADSFTFTASNAGGTSNTATVTINITMAAGLVILNKSTVTMNPTAVGGASSSQMITLFNNSATPITVTPSVVGADFVLSHSGCTGVVAGGGTQCNIWARAVPKAADLRTGTLIVNYSGAPAPLSVDLNVNGVTALTLSTNSMTFAATVVGQGSASQMVNIYNQSGLTVNAVTLNVADANFMVSNTTCTGGLATGTSCNVWVRAVPKSVSTTLSGTLTVYADGVPAGTVALSATGIAGPINLSRTSMAFAPTAVGQGSASQMVTVYNNSGLPITVSPSLAGADFMIANTGCTGTIGVGVQCNIWVRSVPKSVSDSLPGTLIINSSSGLVGTVSLSGSGI
jgi:hypothetical protein